jgi:uncharacterized protein YecE (DUF72 family)
LAGFFFFTASLLYYRMTKKSQASNTLPLFPEESVPGEGRSTTITAARSSEYVQKNKERLHRWASKGILFGTSSWKYQGWKGVIYNRRYPSTKIFNRECLAEYSELFPTVCADFALYDFPNPETMKIIHDQTTDDFRLSLKVTDRITIKRYPNLPRYGVNAGRENPDFLNVELFEDAFLKPIEDLKKKRGAIIFEFSTFHENSGVTYETFVGMIDEFLAKLPKNFEYAVELRNREFLTADYLNMLETHGVAHVLNNWTRMPPIIEQIQLAGVLTAKFSVARALLKPGRTYEEAVELFQPYDHIREENPQLRLGLAEAVTRCIAEGRTLYAYVNNRAEGNSPKTIEAILDILDQYPVEKL